mgnify:CR=1 FL=1
MPANTHTGSSEPYFTLPQAAKELGLPISLLRRAAKSGLLPTHQPFSTRTRVLLSEVRTAIEATQSGGQENG